MVTLDAFSRVVSEIYASTISPTNWPVALNEISRLLDATGGGMLTADGTTRSIMSAAVPSDAQQSYGEYYRHIDYVLAEVETGPVGLVRSGSDLVALKAGSEFDVDWMRPYQMDDGLFVRLTVGAMPTCFLVAAPKRSEAFATAERIMFVNALIGHLQQALRTQDHLADLSEAAGGVNAVIDTIRHGIVIVGPEHGVVQLNSAAEQILKSGDGLCFRSGSIEATRMSVNEQLQASIADAVPQQGCGAPSGNSFACSRPSGKRPYVIHVLPLTATSADPAPVKALVMIVDPEHEHEPSKAVIRRIFGLTNAEADVALRVMRGEGLKPISTDLAVSRATVNTHLQHIFDKTDTHRQAELVRLLLTIIP
jgi:DNA-binding CsgD family transcriptional regulator/PAS domain-containing protein